MRACWIVFLLGVSCAGAFAQLQNEVPPLNTRQTGGDWPVFLGPTGDSISSEKGLKVPWPKEGLRPLWKVAVGEGYGAPSISKGRLFVFDRVDNSARLRCLKAETSEFLWKFEYPTTYRDKFAYNGGPRCCPVIDEERVYLMGVEGMLHCVRLTDGKLLWKVDTLADFDVIPNFFGVGGTPVVEGDLLIAQVGGSPPGSDKVEFGDLKGNGSAVVAFDKRTGKVVWKVGDDLASYSSPVLATVGARRWCFVLARAGLFGLEPKSGKIDFHFPWRTEDLVSVNASNPVVVGDKVFVSECYDIGGALLKVKPGGCEVLWSDAKKKPRDKGMMCHWMTPIHVDGYLYGSSGRNDTNAELRCVELATGKVMWREPRLTRTSLLLVDGHFIVQTEVGPLILVKVNPKQYEEVSLVEVREAGRKEPLLAYPCWAAPVLARGLLYLRGPDFLVCVEATK
jgi:outer membrane protein assembly factor BamB